MNIPEIWIDDINIIKVLLAAIFGLLGGYANSLYAAYFGQDAKYKVRLSAGAIAGVIMFFLLFLAGYDYHAVVALLAFSAGYIGIEFLDTITKKLKPNKKGYEK